MKWSATRSLLTSSFLTLTAAATHTCPNGFFPGTDTVIQTIPYPYEAVLQVIQSFKNLTWSGTPDNLVTLDGPNNVPGTTRTYELLGATIVETLLAYVSPPGGPWFEDHNLHQVTVQLGGNLSITTTASQDSNFVYSVCDGTATEFNLTTVFCADNPTLAASVYHQVHLGDILGAGKLLGGKNFTGCGAAGGQNQAEGTEVYWAWWDQYLAGLLSDLQGNALFYLK